jgi:hypothetical protein
MENKLLSLYLQNAGAADIGDATGLRGSTTAGSVYVSLQTADPGDTAGTGQTQNETAYTNYARQAVARSGAGWAVAAGIGDNVAAITFPQCGASGATITNTALGSATSGAGTRDFNGTASLVVSNGVTPSFAIGALDLSCD